MQNRPYRADCKTVADTLIQENVKANLIYLDPPFNSNRTYSMLFNSRGITAQQKAYHDMWDFTDSTRQLVLDFKTELEAWNLPDSFKKFMEAWLGILEGGTNDDRKLLNYLMYMTQRLVRLRDCLKPTGSIYFHCDPTASHYLKVIMDGVFGRGNFRNEILWVYNRFSRRGQLSPSMHDTILMYSRGKQMVFNKLKTDPRDSKRYLTGHHTVVDGGIKKLLVYDPEKSAHKIMMAKREGTKIQYTQARRPILGNVWTDIPIINPMANERLGYPTRKPLKLLERIVMASSNPGDLVLDPFCGCGTTVEAAHRMGRNWIGIDISGDAVDAIKGRLAKRGVYDGDHYDILEGNPDTMSEYKRLTPFEKQDWLIRRLGGLPNPRKSGDAGIDGEMTFHLGIDKDDHDLWGKLVFSVKTGKQRNPAHIRELQGTMKQSKSQMGILILDTDPTPGMEIAADKAGQFRYQQAENMPPKSYSRIQIVTADEVIEGAQIDCPPTMQAVNRFRKAQQEMRV